MAEYEPFVIERAEGCTLIDIDGRRYLDGASSLWCNIHGHRHPKIDAAVRRQLDKVAHVTNLGSSNPTTILLAKRLVDLAPPGLNHVFFSDDGATSVEVAIKMALQYWTQKRGTFYFSAESGIGEAECSCSPDRVSQESRMSPLSINTRRHYLLCFEPLLHQRTQKTPGGIAGLRHSCRQIILWLYQRTSCLRPERKTSR